MMNRYNETGTIINFSARTYMNHKCICTYASDDEKFHAIIDDYGVMYSPDGKRLLDTVRQLKHYEVPEGQHKTDGTHHPKERATYRACESYRHQSIVA